MGFLSYKSCSRELKLKNLSHRTTVPANQPTLGGRLPRRVALL